MARPSAAQALPCPQPSSMPNVHSQDDSDDSSSDQHTSIIAATAMDLKWFTYTRSSPAEVEGLGIVAHPHPLRSHPCDGYVSHAEHCRRLAEKGQERVNAKQSLDSQRPAPQNRQDRRSWLEDGTAHLVPAGLGVSNATKRRDSELNRRHQQRLTDLDEEMDNVRSPVGYEDDRSIYEDVTVDSDDESRSGSHNNLRKTVTNTSSVISESIHEDEEEDEDTVMILGTVRRDSRRSSSVLRLQHEQGAMYQYGRDWTPVSTPPRSRANTVEGKPPVVRLGTFGPTPPDTPPRVSLERERDGCPSPPRSWASNNPYSSFQQNKQHLAQTETYSTERQSASEIPPPAYDSDSLLAVAARAVQRQQQKQSSSTAPTPSSHLPPHRKPSRSVVFPQHYSASPDSWNGSGLSTPERMISPPPRVERFPSEPTVPSMAALGMKAPPYFAPPPPAMSAPPISAEAHPGIFGPPKVMNTGANGIPSAMHIVSQNLLSVPLSSSVASSRKFGQGPIATSAHKLKKLRLGENISRWTRGGDPSSGIASRFGSEAFWPMTMDKECDKAARILRGFCCGEESAPVFSFSNQEEISQGRPSNSGPAVQIPHHVMASAKGLAIFTTFRAGGLHFSGARGSGVIISRLPSSDSDGTRKWSPPSGFILQTVGAGLRNGGGAGHELSDCVFVLTTDAAVDAFTRPKLGLGSEIGVTPGPVVGEDNLNPQAYEQGGVHVRTTKSDVHIRAGEPILSYTRSTRGAWIGAKASGTIVAVRSDSNASFYGSPEPLSVEKILKGNVPVPAPTRGPLAADGTVMWPEGGLSLVSALQDIERRM